MSDKGWIKLSRQIQDNELWLEDTPFNRRDAWIDLLLMANISQKTIIYRGKNVTIKRGQVYTSIRKLSAKWHWGKDKTLRYIKLLEKLGMVRRESATDFATLLTIVNYNNFQDKQDSKRDTNKDTHKDSDKDSDKDTNKPLLKNIKNNKEYKEEKKEILPSASDSDDEDDEWMTPEEAKKQYEEYLKRKEQGLDE